MEGYLVKEKHILPDSLNAYEYIVEFTNTYKKFKTAPIAVREAHCLDVMWKHWPCPMEEGDLLAGRLLIGEIGFSSEPLFGRSGGFFYDGKQLDLMLESNEYDSVEKDNIRVVKEYWIREESRRNLRAGYPEYMKYALPEDIYWEHPGVAFPLYRMVGAYLDYEKLLRLGLGGLSEEIAAKRDRVEREGGDESLFSGMIMALDQLSCLCRRYSLSAQKLAVQCGDPTDRVQRLYIAGVLDNIALKPPETFIEAMQLVWLYSLVANTLNYGRMDDYLGDYLVWDLEQGILTEKEALEYTSSLWRLIAAKKTVFHGRVIIGGLGRHDEKNADRFALMAIEASRITADIEPQLSMRFYGDQNPELMERALDCIGEGRTYPILYNDDVNIPAVMDAFSVSREEAVNYMMFGCGEYV
ncbi:MAG: hypothetical protein LBG22_06125, partial [Treponema sp.]|nr:hypothetical protein [Treponema sp.]